MITELSDLVSAKISLKEVTAKSKGEGMVYLKAKNVEREILEENPPKIVLDIDPIYRKSLISVCFKNAGYLRQGKHNSHPLWKKAI